MDTWHSFMAYTPSETPKKPVYKQSNLKQITQAVEAGDCVLVLGPRHHAKRELLEWSAEILQATGDYYTSYLSLREVPLASEQTYFVGLATEALLISEADFFTGLYQNLLRQWPFRNSGRINLPTSVTEFRDALLSLMERSDRHLVLFIGDLEMAPPNLVVALLQALEMVYTAVSIRSRFQFQAVLGGALTRHQLSDPRIASFQKQVRMVWVENLTEPESNAFIKAHCKVQGIQPSDMAVKMLFRETRGDQILIDRVLRIAFDQMQRKRQKELTPARIDEAMTQFLALPTDRELLDILRQVESAPDLLFSTISIAEQGKVAASKLPAAKQKSPNMLDLCGIFRRSRAANYYQFKSRLWKELFQKNLNMTRVGGVYAIGGYWHEAFRYLGQAIQTGHSEVKSELLTAVINAMHGTENGQHASIVLGAGLEAMYPENDLTIYRKQGNFLQIIYPQNSAKKPKRVPLSQKNNPAVRALTGHEYTISFTDQTPRLWIPLRYDANPESTIGLLSIGSLLSQTSPYKRQEEVKQLTGFLRQAAQVIRDRSEYADLLSAAEGRANKLNFLNTILTRILNYHEWSERDILRLVIGGITAPQGLDFSRAMLFVANEDFSALNGRFAYGALNERDARTARQKAQNQSLDEMIEQHLSQLEQDLPLEKIAHNIEIPLDSEEANIFLQCFNRHDPVQSTPLRPLGPLPQKFVKQVGESDSYALIPLTIGQQRFGVLYVDDKFSEQLLNNERFELLQTFMNQAVLALENARALRAEREQANQLRQLLKVEERINDQIGRSMSALLEEIVRSAAYMFNADSAVLYPFKQGSGVNQLVYDSVNITAQNLKHPVHATSRLRTTQGMATRVIRQGQMIVHNVAGEEYVNGRTLATHPFIVRENIRSFVSVRLGPAEAPVGLLFLNWEQAHEFPAKDLPLLEALANFAAVAIPSARRYQQLQADLLRQEKEFKNVDEIFQSNIYFRSEENMEQAINLTLRNVKETTQTPYLYLIRNEPFRMWHRYYLSSMGDIQSDWPEYLPQGIVQDSFTSAQNILVNSTHPGDLRNRYHHETQSALAIPVKVEDHCMAVLYLEHPDADGLTSAHQELLEKMATGLALTLEQAERSNVMRELMNISQELTKEVNLEHALSFLLKQAMGAMATVDAITIYYEDRNTNQIKRGYAPGLGDERVMVDEFTAVPNSIVNRIWQSEQPSYVPDVKQNLDFHHAFPTAQNLRSVAAFPLSMGERTVGCIFFGYSFQHNFGKSERDILVLFAQLATIAILRVSLYDEAEQRQANLDKVGRITPIISANLGSEEDIFAVIVKELKVAFPMADNICIIQKNHEDIGLMNEIINDDYYQAEELPQNGDTFISMGRRGIDTRVFRTGKSALVPDVMTDPDYVTRVPTTKSELCVPIKVDQKSQYVVVLESDQLRAFGADDMRLLEMLAEHVGIALQNEEQFAKAQRQRVGERTAMMATGLIHDINSAVASIPDLVDELADKIERGKDYSYPLADLRKNAEMTGRISGRLREFVITGRYEPAQVDLHAMLTTAINISKSREPRNVQTKIQIPDDVPEIYADELWLQLLVKNLLVNAYRAIPADREGVVHLTLETMPDHIILRVRDNGEGIPADKLKKVFDFGYTTKEGTRKMQGVGLYHSRLIAETHKGELTVDSKFGEWTEFTLQLPYVSPATIEFKTADFKR